MAKPLKIAPATKYGGKIVECHPGSLDSAKSMLTMLCTLKTRGVPSPARSSCPTRAACHCRAEPEKPRAKNAYARRLLGVRARSRAVARSGIRPRYQNKSESSEYVMTATTSHVSALMNCGQVLIVEGYGISQ